jgi:hypothetical protein
MIITVNIAYLLVLLGFFLMSAFIVFHILAYSYNKLTAVATLVIFISVASVLFLSSVTLFYTLRWDKILAPIL